jgi:serine/threonine-protein phosphatase 6 regulatory subunit 3
MYLRLGFQNRSHIDVQLLKEDCTLENLLEEDDIVQEARAQNSKLIDFILKDENVTKLINYVSVEYKVKIPEGKEGPDVFSDDEEVEITKKIHKFPQICCDIVCSGVDSLYDLIVNDETYLKAIFSYLKEEHVHQSFLLNWVKLVTNLQEKRPVQVRLAFFFYFSRF